MTFPGDGVRTVSRATRVVSLSIWLAWASGGPGPARADDWTIVPHVELRESYTDNVRGISGPDKSSDLLSTVMAGVVARNMGARATVAFSYDLAYDKYPKSGGTDGFRHDLLGIGVLDVVPEHLFLDTRAAVSQQPIRRQGATSAIDRSLPSNQTRVINYGISPYYAHAFGDWAEVEARYRFNQVLFTDTRTSDGTDAPSNGLVHDLSLVGRSGRGQTRFLWDGLIQRIHTDLGDGDTRDETIVQGNHEFRFNRVVSAMAGLGYESITDTGPASDIKGPIWMVGGRLTPGPRTEFLLQYGRRFGERQWTGELSHQFTPHLTVRAGYHVTVASQQEVFTNRLDNIGLGNGEAVDPATGLVPAPNAVPLDLTDTTQRRKTLAATLIGTYPRTRFTVGGYRTVREDLDFGGRDVLIGADVTASRDITETLTLGVGASISRTLETTSTLGKDTTFGYGVSLAHRFNPTLTGSVGYDRRRVIRERAESYGENVIMARLRKEF